MKRSPERKKMIVNVRLGLFLLLLALFSVRIAAGITPATSYLTIDNSEVSGTTLIDSYGIQNGSLPSGGTTGVSGIIGQAVSLTRASNQYVDTGETPPASGDWSAVWWVKSSYTGGYMTLADTGGNVGYNRPGLFMRTRTSAGAGVYLQLNSATGAIMGTNTTTTNINDNVWHQLALVYNDTAQKMTLYIDGVERIKLWKNYDGGLKLIYARRTNGADYMQGLLDEAGYWGSHALTQTEITSLYNGGAGQRPYFDPAFTIYAKNAVTNTTINTFNATVTYQGGLVSKNYSTTNGTIITNITISDSARLNITIRAPDYYEATSTNVNVSSLSYTGRLVQAYVTFNCYEKYSQYQLACNETGPQPRHAGANTELVGSPGYYPQNVTYNLTAKTNTTISVSGFYDYNLTIKANDYAGSPESNFTINISIPQSVNKTPTNTTGSTNFTYDFNYSGYSPIAFYISGSVTPYRFDLPSLCRDPSIPRIQLKDLVSGYYQVNCWTGSVYILINDNTLPDNKTLTNPTMLEVGGVNNTQYVANGTSINFELLSGLTYPTVLNATSTIHGDPINQLGYANITNKNTPPTTESYQFNLTAAREINFSVYYENNLSSFDKNITISLTPLGQSDLYYEVNTSNGTATLYSIPTGTYKITFNSTGYLIDSRYIILTTYASQDINAYMRSDSSGIQKSFYVVNSQNLKQNGWYIWFQRRYNNTGWITTDEGRSNIDGLVYQNVLENEYYRVLLYNTTLGLQYQSDPTLLLSNTTYQISPTTTSVISNQINASLGVSTSFSIAASNTSTNITAIGTSTSGSRNWTFELYRNYIDGPRLINSTKGSGESKALTLKIPSSDAKYEAVMSVEGGIPVASVGYTRGGGPSVFGVTGLAYSLILIIAMIGLGSFTAYGAIGLGILGLIVSLMTGLMGIGIGAVIGFVFIGALIIYRRTT